MYFRHRSSVVPTRREFATRLQQSNLKPSIFNVPSSQRDNCGTAEITQTNKSNEKKSSDCDDFFFRPSLLEALFCSVDDLVLQRFVEVAEEIGVAGYADNEVFVVLRVLLGFDEGLSVDNVELDVVTVHCKV